MKRIMYCINNEQTTEETLKKSRFISVIVPCDSEKRVITCLKKLHEQHPNASHIAFAYRIKSPKGLVCRFNDAGEPTGTAGKPIYQHLEGKQLINVFIAVIRYFGGVKLGAGGLTRAYGNSAARVIEAAKVIEYIEYATVKLVLAYKDMAHLTYQLKKLNGAIIKQDFTEHITLSLLLPEKNVETLSSQPKNI